MIIDLGNGLSPACCQGITWTNAYDQLDPSEQISVEFDSQYNYIHQTKYIWKRLQSGGHVVPGFMCSAIVISVSAMEYHKLFYLLAG